MIDQGRRLVGHRDAHDQIEALGNGIDEAVVEQQFDAQAGMGGHEVGDGGTQMQGAKGHRRVEPQAAARLVVVARQGTFGLVELGEQDAAALEIGPAGVGGRDMARRAVEELHAKLGLQRQHLTVERRARKACAPRRGGKAARLLDRDEGTHG